MGKGWHLAGLVLIAACGNAQETERPRVIPAETLVETPAAASLPELTDAAMMKKAEILETTARDSLRRFSRIADASDGFVSNFADSDHFGHWSLLRRTGVDPMRQIEALFLEPHAARAIGGETWFIWPDFAAMAPEDLLPGRLGFQDRARLAEMVGEDGIAAIRQGSAYTGIRTAISADGRWVYYLHDIGTDQTEGEE